MGRPQFFFTALFVLVVCTLFPIVVLGNKKAAIFNKIADTTRNVQADPVTTGASAFLNKAGRFSLEGFMDAFEDLTLKQWGTPKTTLDTELIGLMRDVFVQDKDHTRLMQDAWADPEILRTLMEDLPMFDVIKPLRALKEKETLTAKDGIQAVLVLKDTMGKVLASLESIRNPASFAEKMYKYATSEDPKWKSLLARIEEGDTTSHLEAQQFLLNEEIGDLIDLEAFGFGGTLPDILAKSIKTTQGDEPLLWDSILTDPVAKAVISDPMAVVKQVVDAAMDAADYAK